MVVQLANEVTELLKDDETVKVLATTNENGVPHVAIKQSIQLGEDGKIIYLELLESSKTNKNLVKSIWFNRKVAIALKGKEKESYQIIGRAVKAIISGPVFQKHYVDIREKLGDVDLATVWVIEPEEVSNQTFSVRKAQEEATHPIFKHLDRLNKS
jgi:general stress protein 26